MPPDGYTTVTISDNLATKLTRIMSHHDPEALGLLRLQSNRSAKYRYIGTTDRITRDARATRRCPRP